jgi:hypothetical protein
MAASFEGLVIERILNFRERQHTLMFFRDAFEQFPRRPRTHQQARADVRQ